MDTALVEEYLQSEDSDVFLVSLSERIQSGYLNDTAEALLHEKCKDVLRQLGWDLLTLFVPHLQISHSHGWQLICRIAEVCSPKEMSIAFLEQMEILSDVVVIFMMLQPLRKVLVQLKQELVLCSTLHSIHRLIQQHYRTLQEIPDLLEQPAESVPTEFSAAASEVLSSPAVCGSESCSDTLASSTQAEAKVENGEDQLNDEVITGHSDLASGDVSQCGERLSVDGAVKQALGFIQPFTGQIQQPNRPTPWSPVQRECIVLLMTLLDEPLVGLNLGVPKRGMLSNTHRTSAEAIMAEIVKCRCGCVQLLECRPLAKGSKRDDADMEEEEASRAYEDQDGCTLPPLGLGCFAYLLLVEGIEDPWFPSVLNPAYLLHIGLDHISSLIERTEKTIIAKGLSLLKAVISRVSDHSIASHVLDDRRYLQVAELLADIMVFCPERNTRQLSVQLFQDFMRCFVLRGRYRMQRSLLQSVSHAGVIGLVICSIKDEVDIAFKTGDTEGPYFGGGLVPILEKVMCISHDTNVLEEADKVMSALNFLRYLLIRDKPVANQTGVWHCIGWLQSKFTRPLRSSLYSTRTQCQQEMDAQKHQEKSPTGSRQVGAEVEVKVLGGSPPNMTPQQELKMMSLALHQLDMMESVLVRVEELLEQSAGQ